MCGANPHFVFLRFKRFSTCPKDCTTPLNASKAWVKAFGSIKKCLSEVATKLGEVRKFRLVCGVTTLYRGQVALFDDVSLCEMTKRALGDREILPHAS